MNDQSESMALAIREAGSVELGTISAKNPAALVRQATEAADALAGVIRSRKLFSKISGREFVRCEGWTTLAAMMGVLPRELSVVKHEDGGYEATVELVRMNDGAVLTRASAECGMDETTWAKRDAYARRSMAITRATSKACRIAFSWVMVLAGYEATPAEEIPNEPEERNGHSAKPEVRDVVTMESTIPFGKHKGKTVKDVGPDYFEHLAGKLRADDSPHAPTKAFVEAALLVFFPAALRDTDEDLALDRKLAGVK